MIGEQVSHYRVLAQLGSGGMGMVYEAEDLRLGRRVALKILPEQFSCDPQMVARFHLEARAASALNHPNICTIFDIGEHHGKKFIAMELLTGETLKHRITFDTMKIGEILSLSLSLLDAVGAAHAKGIIHRDLKPGNIFLTEMHRPKILDFGLAKVKVQRAAKALAGGSSSGDSDLTESGVSVGTVAYMSPEQARGDPLDPRSDLFSFGVVMYEMTTGRKPFDGATSAVIFDGILNKTPQPPSQYNSSVPPSLDLVILRAIQKDPADRYQSAAEMAADVAAVKSEWEGRGPALLKGSSTQTQSAVVTGLPRKARRWTAARILALAAALGLLAGVALLVASRGRQALTEKDSIVLADFVNNTGEPVFDQTLRQAVAVQLSQSPFLNIVPQQRVRYAMQLAGHSPDEPLTGKLAREICEREDVKAMLGGSIAKMGDAYVMTLEAVNCRTGETIAREQAQAPHKEQVLSALGQATSRLRGELGESLASIQKNDKPIEEATTGSLDALKAYSLGQQWRAKGVPETEAIPFFERAIELDPTFASSYARLSAIYANMGQTDKASDYIQKAYLLRDHVSDAEKLYIESHYYQSYTGDLQKLEETLRLWEETYPRDWQAANNLSYADSMLIGNPTEALQAAQVARERGPGEGFPYNVEAQAYLTLNRFEEARRTYEAAINNHIDNLYVHQGLLQVSFAMGDMASVNANEEWAKGRPGEHVIVELQSNIAAYYGKEREARVLDQRAVELAQQSGFKASEGAILGRAALEEALVGKIKEARDDAAGALKASRDRDTLSYCAVTQALAGQTDQSRLLVQELETRYPSGTLVNAAWVPSAKAVVEMQNGDPSRAVDALDPARTYELAMALHYVPTYLRGLAFLKSQSGYEASQEFQRIIDHRGVDATSPIYPLAKLGLARSFVLQNDTERARAAYEDVLKIWKDADPDFLPAKQARDEYAKLGRGTSH